VPVSARAPILEAREGFVAVSIRDIPSLLQWGHSRTTPPEAPLSTVRQKCIEPLWGCQTIHYGAVPTLDTCARQTSHDATRGVPDVPLIRSTAPWLSKM